MRIVLLLFPTLTLAFQRASSKVLKRPIYVLMIMLCMHLECTGQYEQLEERFCIYPECPKLTFEAASEFCQSKGGTLIILNSITKGTSLIKWLKSKGVIQGVLRLMEAICSVLYCSVDTLYSEIIH